MIRKAALGAKALGARLFARLHQHAAGSHPLPREESSATTAESSSGTAASSCARPFSTEELDRVFGPKVERPAYPPVLMFVHTGEPDEPVFADWLLDHPDIGAIIMPRGVDPSTLSRLTALFGPRAILLSDSAQTEVSAGTIVIIDHPSPDPIVHTYADITYIGGGFDNTLTSILPCIIHDKEPLAVPVLFGPDYRRDPTADDLRILGGAQQVSSADSFLCHAGRLVYDLIERRKRARWTAEYAAELLAGPNPVKTGFGC